MRPNWFFRTEHLRTIAVSLIVVLLFTSMVVKAQTPVNFAGKWEFDKTASSPGQLESNYNGSVIMQITQNASTISFSEIWISPGNQDFKTAADTYYLDGKERIKKHSVGTNKNSAKWSADKHVLTIANCDTQKLKGVAQDFLVTDTYTLSGNGLTLTIDRYSMNPVKGETTVRMVYNKKIR
jgi:hypothetical protein